jgi:tetratricopeptide (TPR) repeat protein
MRMRLHFAGFAVLLFASGALTVVACGGDPSPKTPENPSASTSAPAPVATAAPTHEVDYAADEKLKSEVANAAKAAYERGFAAWRQADLAGAKAAFREAADKDSKSPAPLYSLGTVNERLGDNAQAERAYRDAIAVDEGYELAIGALSALLARTGHTDDAESLLNSKLRKAPGSARLKTYLAEVKSIAGDPTGAQKIAQEVLRDHPEAKEAMIVIARDHYRARRYDVALYAVRAIVEGSPDIPARDKDNAEVRLLRGLIKRELGDRMGALADFEEAIARRPDLFEGYVNVGEMKLEAGNAQAALPVLEQAVKYAPANAIARLDLGDCYRLLGRTAEAKRELEYALRQDSSLAHAHYNLGLLYLYSPSVVGVSDGEKQMALAIKSFETFKSMKGTGRGFGDDVDDLLSTAKRKQAEIKVKKQAEQPAPSPAGPAATVDGGAR